MKINSLNKNANSINKENSTPQIEPLISSNHRSKRNKKKIKEDSFTSSINDDLSDELPPKKEPKRKSNPPQKELTLSIEPTDIILEGTILYRYALDQIELEGHWHISSENSKEKFAYLLVNKKNCLQIPIDYKDITFDEDINNHNNTQQEGKFVLNLSSGNIFEVLLIPNKELFNNILKYLSGEYNGYFVYYGKTIEDKFTLNFVYEDNEVRVSGEGMNNLGEFEIIGFVNFYTIKEELVGNNNIESDVIRFGVFKVTRIYNEFNMHENTRVIKSFQHSRKKYENEFV